MRAPPIARRRQARALEVLEPRCLLSSPGDVTIPLDPTLDQFGDQIVTIQTYTQGALDPNSEAVGTFGIFDTGASAVTFSPDDATLFGFFNQPIPIRNPGGAVAGGIGGEITGDVSQPGTIVVDGMHASTLSFTPDGFPNFGFDFKTAASTPGIQAFVGTQSGSPDLPTITGTPVLHPTNDHPDGLAALVDLRGATLDFSDVAPGLILQEPDLHFVTPSTTISAGTGTTDPITVALTPYGNDNFDAPGDLLTDTHLTTQSDVSVVTDPRGDGHLSHADHKNFLFDTGSQLTVISTATAQALGLDLSKPETTIDVQGVGGTETVPGYTITALTLPTAAGGTLTFTDVPVYVLDVADDIDGILGMNLLDTADQLLYNPFDTAAGRPTVTFTFFTDPNRGGGGGDGSVGALFGKQGLSFFAGAFGGHSLPEFGGSKLQFAAATAAANESQASVTIEISRTGNLSAAQTVHVATSGGTAKDGVNYRAVSTDLRFAPGQKTATLAIPLLDDHVVTGDLSLKLTLSQPGGGAALGTRSSATVTIHNTDAAGTIQFDEARYVVNEDAGTAMITVTRSGGDAGGVSVAYTTSDGSAKGGTNYTPQSGTLTFGVGETSRTFTVPILDDGQFSGDKEATLTLSRAGGGGSLGLGVATLLIREADARPVPLVTVLDVHPGTDRKGIITVLTLTVSAPLDAASVSNLANYDLVQAGPDSRSHVKGSRKLPLRSAIYDPGALTITLRPRGRFTLSKPVQLTVSGLIDASGRAVDGNRDGQPGGALVVVLRRGVGSSSRARVTSRRVIAALSALR